MAFVRGFAARDKDEMVVVFHETADPVLASKGEEALRIGCHTYCIPYYSLQPENCFVLDDGNGRAVGYVIGTPDNRRFAQQWRQQYIQLLEDRGIFKPKPGDTDPLSEMRLNAHSPEQKLLGPPLEALLNDFPGHLHIDIRPGWQGKGFGVILMETFLDHAKQNGCQGVHLGMLAANKGAERFYRRLDFGPFPHVLDGGKSGEEGRDGPVVYMVKTLAHVKG